MNPLNFFPNPQQEAQIRNDIYRQRPVINANTTGITNTQLDSNGNPLQLGNSAEFVPVQIVSKNGSTTDSNGYYHCRLLFPWMNTQQDDEIGIVTHVRLDGLGASLTERSMHLAQYWSVTLDSPDTDDDGYLLLKLVVPGNLPIVVVQIDGKDDSTNPADNIGVPDLIAPIGDDLCLWDAQILSLTSHGGTLACGYLSYPSETEGPSKCLCFDIGYYGGAPDGNRRLIRVGGNYFGTYVTDIPDPANPTSRRLPVFAIKSECAKGEVYKLLDNGDGSANLVCYNPEMGYFEGGIVNTVALGSIERTGGTSPVPETVKYATYQEDTGLFEYIPAPDPLIPVKLRRKKLFTTSIESSSQVWLYEWTYRLYTFTDDGIPVILDTLDYGGLLPPDPVFTQVQSGGAGIPDVYTLNINIGGNGPHTPCGDRTVGGTLTFQEDADSTDPGTIFTVPYGSTAAEIQAGLTHFTVTGSVNNYTFVGLDNVHHSLTFTPNLTPSDPCASATFDNQDAAMDVPVNAKIQLAHVQGGGTDPTRTLYTVIWSNGTQCTGPIGGVDPVFVMGYDPATFLPMYVAVTNDSISHPGETIVCAQLIGPTVCNPTEMG